jgi:3-hydroxyacyl-CoA dehydrogenase
MNYANAGIPVLLKKWTRRPRSRHRDDPAQLRVTMSKGEMTASRSKNDGADHADDQLRRLRPGGLVTEAVFENMDVKKATFTELGKVTRPDHPRVEFLDA